VRYGNDPAYLLLNRTEERASTSYSVVNKFAPLASEISRANELIGKQEAKNTRTNECMHALTDGQLENCG